MSFHDEMSDDKDSRSTLRVESLASTTSSMEPSSNSDSSASNDLKAVITPSPVVKEAESTQKKATSVRRDVPNQIEIKNSSFKTPWKIAGNKKQPQQEGEDEQTAAADNQDFMQQVKKLQRQPHSRFDSDSDSDLSSDSDADTSESRQETKQDDQVLNDEASQNFAKQQEDYQGTREEQADSPSESELPQMSSSEEKKNQFDRLGNGKKLFHTQSQNSEDARGERAAKGTNLTRDKSDGMKPSSQPETDESNLKPSGKKKLVDIAKGSREIVDTNTNVASENSEPQNDTAKSTAALGSLGLSLSHGDLSKLGNGDACAGEAFTPAFDDLEKDNTLSNETATSAQKVSAYTGANATSFNQIIQAPKLGSTNVAGSSMKDVIEPSTSSPKVHHNDTPMMDPNSPSSPKVTGTSINIGEDSSDRLSSARSFSKTDSFLNAADVEPSAQTDEIINTDTSNPNDAVKNNTKAVYMDKSDQAQASAGVFVSHSLGRSAAANCKPMNVSEASTTSNNDQTAPIGTPIVDSKRTNRAITEISAPEEHSTLQSNKTSSESLKATETSMTPEEAFNPKNNTSILDSATASKSSPTAAASSSGNDHSLNDDSAKLGFLDSVDNFTW